MNMNCFRSRSTAPDAVRHDMEALHGEAKHENTFVVAVPTIQPRSFWTKPQSRRQASMFSFMKTNQTLHFPFRSPLSIVSGVISSGTEHLSS